MNETIGEKGLWLLSLTFVLASCMGSGESYNEVLKTELARGVRYDSIFLGINIDMTSKDFYALCWKLNKEGAVINGPGNLSVEYRVKEGMADPAYMRFYPDFEEEKIAKMDIEFGYLNWAPWNKSLSVDSLLLDAKNVMQSWYGDRDFMMIEDSKGSRKVWVKIDGNRRIRLWKADVRKVQGDIADLTKLNLDKK